MKNYTIIYTVPDVPMPQAFTTFGKTPQGALRSFRLNKGFAPNVLTIAQLPDNPAPKSLNARDWETFNAMCA